MATATLTLLETVRAQHDDMFNLKALLMATASRARDSGDDDIDRLLCMANAKLDSIHDAFVPFI